MKRQSYLIFHLNLFFSSVEEKDRKNIINKCYYPLLNIAKIQNIPINIEATARTLLEIKKIDKQFIFLLKKLINEKKIYFIGSGFNQIISPLVPYEITKKNLSIGNNYYKKILGYKPKIALINEMAYSEDISEIYFDEGYRSIIIDYDNTKSAKKNIEDNINPYLKINKNKKLNIIYASSFLFQQFQNCVYGDISIDKYLKIISNYKRNVLVNLPVYSGDGEIFNFRVGRFKEERYRLYDEWNRIYEILNLCKDKLKLNFILINKIKNYTKHKPLEITDSTSPIIVKKQPKYNVSRWAITGRSDQIINTYCFKFLKDKKNLIKKFGNKNFYECLLNLWASDFRTHITEKRWKNYLKNLNKINRNIIHKENHYIKKNEWNNINKHKIIKFNNEKNLLKINTNKIKIILNVRRGLAVQALSFKSHNFKKIIGTLNREKIKSIYEGPDYYTGNTTHENFSNYKKSTDLNNIIPKYLETNNYIKIFCRQTLPFGNLEKIISIAKNKEELTYQTNYKVNKKNKGSIKINNITFLNINDKKIYYHCTNGGKKIRKYLLKEYFDHTFQPSKFISMNNGLGCTDSKIKFNIEGKNILFSWDNSENYVMPSLLFKKVNNQKILRLFFSNLELDETSHKTKSNYVFKLKISSK